MQWDSTGTLLIVNSHKNYLGLYKLESEAMRQNLGRVLTASERTLFIQDLYGVASVKDIQNQKLDVYMAGIDYSDDS